MSQDLRRHLLACIALAVVACAFFGQLTIQPTRTLYSDRSDLIALHLPMKQFLVRSYQQTGEIPLWNPYTYGGMPFAADVQVAAFYPLHAPLYLLPESSLGAALSWLVVLHILIAGWCMYAYASWQGLQTLPAFVSACGYMLAGKWLLHLLAGGHYPMVGLAWTPLVLLFLDLAIRRSNVWLALWAGAIFGLMTLGSHPQVTFYAGLFVALWELGPALESAGWFGHERVRSLPRAVGIWLGLGLLTAGSAAALAAIQLLPNLELVPFASRSGGMTTHESLVLTFWKLTQLVGPPPGELAWEDQGGLGVLWVAASLMAVVIGPPRLRFQALVAAVLIAFGIGGAALFEGLPGFNLFRIPARMLWFVAIPTSLLTGQAVQAIFYQAAMDPRGSRRCRLILLSTGTVALVLIAFNSVMVRHLGQPIQPSARLYWVLGTVLLLGCYILLMGVPRPWQRGAALLFSTLLVAELWLIAWPAVQVVDVEHVYTPSACVEYLAQHNDGAPRVLDRDLPRLPANAPLGFVQPYNVGIEPVRGWNSLDVNRYHRFLGFIGDMDGPTRPHDIVDNFPIKHKHLLDLLAVRYLLQPAGRQFRVGEESPIGSDPRWRAVFLDTQPEAYGVVNNSGIRRFPPYVVYENTDPLPRAWVVPKARPLPEGAATLEALKNFNPRQEVLVEGTNVNEDSRVLGSSQCRQLTRCPNELAYEVETDAPAYLVLSEVWFPGWSCTIDGEPARVLRANFAFRAVAIPAGRHEVVLRYQPLSLWLGSILSLVTVALLLTLAGCYAIVRAIRHRQVHPRVQTATPDGARTASSLLRPHESSLVK